MKVIEGKGFKFELLDHAPKRPPVMKCPKGDYVEMLEEFLNSEYPAAEIICNGRSANAVGAGLRYIIRSHGLPLEVYESEYHFYIRRLER